MVKFPLRGEWTAINTPAHRIPSHGTDYLGQRYAFDFVAQDHRGKLYSASFWRHLIGKVQVQDCYAWSQPVFSPIDGVVVDQKDGWPDRQTLNVVRDQLMTYLVWDRIGTDLRPLCGNYVVIQAGTVVSLLAHLRLNSIRVNTGEKLSVGHIIAEVGNSGNTTMPHLHFQLMDDPNPMIAKGLPCTFDHYERWDGTSWESVFSGVPGRMERLRILE